jgi:uncharacterized membrane protein YfhO
MVGVIAFMKSKKKHWASRLILICIVCAFIPVLNSAFYMLNASYYARWFYMPILILAMMTAHTLDDENSVPEPGIKICGAMLIAFAVIAVLPTKNDDGTVSLFDLPRDIDYFLVTLIIAAVSLIAAVYIFHRKKQHRPFMQRAIILTAAASMICTMTTVFYGAIGSSAAKDYVNAALKGSDSVYEEVSDDNFFRVDISENYDNYPMAWGLPSMRAFQSVVSSSIMEFYNSIGIQRDVASRPDTSHYTLRGLLSVKYYYKHKNDDTDIESVLPEFKLVAENEYFDIYQNQLYIPMGFAYDTYISQEAADEKGDSMRESILMKALVLSDEQIEKYSDILSEVSVTDSYGLTKADYERFCKEKQQCCSSSFTYDSKGFEAEITLDKSQLVFFSVPYSDGWTAEVNGQPVDIEKVSYGFMAVKADSGTNTITFRYHTPGLDIGIIISVIGVSGLVIYLIICRLCRRKNKLSCHTHSYDYTPCSKISAADEYADRLSKRRNL